MKKDNGVWDDKILFFVIAVILLVAIAIIGVWFFTKDDKLNTPSEKTPVVEEEKNDSDEEKDDDEKQNEVVVVKPIVPEEKEQEAEVIVPEVPEVIIWQLPETVEFLTVGKKMVVNNKVIVDDEEFEAFVTIQRETSADVWTNIDYYNFEFIPVESGNYRLVYLYNEEFKYVNFMVQKEMVSMVANNLVNDDGTGGTLMNQTVFRDLMYNQALVSVSTLNDLHMIKVAGLLKADENTGLIKNFGLIVDLSGQYSEITTISAVTPGIEVIQNNSLSYGANTEKGLVLLLIDSAKFVHKEQTEIELLINEESYLLNVVVDNWQIPAYVQNTVIDQKEIVILPEVFVNESLTPAKVSVEEFIDDVWTEITLVDNKFVPQFTSLYRYVYEYDAEEKIVDINVIENILDADVDKVDIEDEYVENDVISEEDYNVINNNQDKITVTKANDKITITVKSNLEYFSDESLIRIPIGMILDFNSDSRFSEITNVETTSSGLIIAKELKEVLGIVSSYEILVVVDAKEFEIGKEYVATLKVYGKDLESNDLEIEEAITIIFEEAFE